MEQHQDKPKKQSFSLPRDLEQRLQAERERFERAHGVPMSLNAIAVKVMRAGLAAEGNATPSN